MKKFIILALSFVSSSIFAHPITVTNTLTQDAAVYVSYVGGGVCGNDTWYVKAGERISKETGLCCLDQAYLVVGSNNFNYITAGNKCRGMNLFIELYGGKPIIREK